MSVSREDPQKVACAHNSLRANANASEKVGQGFSYHAARRTNLVPSAIRWWAKRVTSENRPKSAGVVRRIASSDHCRWVSTPRCRRTSWKVTSICQRKTNHDRIRSGSAVRSVHSRAWVAKVPCGSRTSTQRRGTGGNPVWYQTPVSETTSTVRSPPPYQSATVTGFQAVLGSSATTARLGRRLPFR